MIAWRLLGEDHRDVGGRRGVGGGHGGVPSPGAGHHAHHHHHQEGEVEPSQGLQ